MTLLTRRLAATDLMALVRRGLRRIGRRARPDPRPDRGGLQPPRLNGRINELIRLAPRPTSDAGYRINLVVPALSASSAYGGIQTALDLFEAVSEHEARRRIIVVGAVDDGAASALSTYRRVEAVDDTDDPRQLVAIDPTADSTLPVGPDDVFLATYWTTAELVVRFRRWQTATYGTAPQRFGYLVQDYEPAFYASSAQSMLASATYDDQASIVAIFNTALLRDHFHRQGIRFGDEFTFEPRLSPTLRRALAETPTDRRRQILVYGRPRKPRNAFPLIVEGLRTWRGAYAEADRWSVVSVGEEHPPVDLGHGTTMPSSGKLDLRGYAELMRTSAIGISMMASPHPSYPPLEMSAFGLLVLTNRFGAKDLSTWHTNIVSLREISIAGFSSDLIDLCDRFSADPAIGDNGRLLRPEYLDSEPQFPFADTAARLLRGA